MNPMLLSVILGVIGLLQAVQLFILADLRKRISRLEDLAMGR